MSPITIIILIAYSLGLISFLVLFYRDEDPRSWSAAGMILIWPLALFYGYFIRKQEHL